MNRTQYILLLIGLLLPSFADEEALKFLKELDKKIYRPSEHGLNDLSATIVNDSLKKHPMLASIDAKFYFKKGSKNQKKLVVTGLKTLPDDLKKIQSQVDQFEKQYYHFFDLYAKELLGNNFEEQIQEYETITLKRDPKYDSVVLIPKATSYLSQYFTSQTLSCHNYHIMIIETTNLDGTRSRTNFQYKDQFGKIVIDKIESRVSTSRASYVYEYEKIDGVVLLKKITGKGVSGNDFNIEFTDIKINKGIQDSIFNE